MKRIRIVGLCLTAMFVLGVATASASAHEYQVEGGTLPQKITGGSKTVSKLEGTVLGKKITIECAKQTVNSGEILEGNKSNGEITYEGCSVKENATCEVPNIKFKIKDELTGPTPGVQDTFLPTGASEEFVSIKIKVCALAGTYPVKGKQVCNLPGGEVFAATHTIECLPAGSSLTLGTEPAFYTGSTEVSLVSGLKFRAI